MPKKLPGFKALTINYFLSALAMALVSTFGVVYVFKLGTTWQAGLVYVLAFYGWQRLTSISIMPLTGKLVSKKGFRRVMIGSLLALVGKLALLIIGNGNWLFLMVAATLGGIYLGAYNVGFDGLFLADNHNEKVGQEYGWLVMLQRFGEMMAPLAGGIIVTKFGFMTLFATALVLVLLSCLPMWIMEKHKRAQKTYQWSHVVELLKEKWQYSSELVTHEVVESVLTFFWPIYLLLVLKGSYAGMGAVISAVSVVSSTGVFFIGKIYDHRPLNRVFPFATMLTALGYGLRFMSANPMWVVSSDAVSRLFSPFWWMRLRRWEFALGEKVERVVFSVAQEFLTSVGMLLGLALGIILLLITGLKWEMLGFMGAVGVVVSAWIHEEEAG